MSKCIYEKQTYGDTTSSIDDWIREQLRHDNAELDYYESKKDGIEDRLDRIECAIGVLVAILTNNNMLSIEDILNIAGIDSYSSRRKKIKLIEEDERIT